MGKSEGLVRRIHGIVGRSKTRRELWVVRLSSSDKTGPGEHGGSDDRGKGVDAKQISEEVTDLDSNLSMREPKQTRLTLGIFF